MFKKEGNDTFKSIKEARKILKEADNETKKKETDVKTKRRQRKESYGYVPIDWYRQACIALEIMKTNQEGKSGCEDVNEGEESFDKGKWKQGLRPSDHWLHISQF